MWFIRIQGVTEGIHVCGLLEYRVSQKVCVWFIRIQGVTEGMCVVYKNTGCRRRYVCGL